MALPATQSLFSSRQQFERGVIARFHGKCMNRIAGAKIPARSCSRAVNNRRHWSLGLLFGLFVGGLLRCAQRLKLPGTSEKRSKK